MYFIFDINGPPRDQESVVQRMGHVLEEEHRLVDLIRPKENRTPHIFKFGEA
jgi:hypothetical protein